VGRGLAKPCPVPVVVDETDGTCWPPNDAPREDVLAFDAWRATACAHPHMQLLSERVGNWASVRTLQAALGVVGAPARALLAAIPDANGGALEAADIPACLEALDAFRRLYKWLLPRLVDGDTGALVYTYVEAYRGEFVWSNTGNVGFDHEGLFVRDGEVERFRAHRVLAKPAEGGSVLEDLDDGATTRCAWSHESERRYEVVPYVETAQEYAWQLDVLERLFRAALDEGTRVVWC
jgi:hypothetical protein